MGLCIIEEILGDNQEIIGDPVINRVYRLGVNSINNGII